ncbi:hypothetical protein B0H11DRAFT_487608 [Mycena galericulata]|nr:hypothetical protein B0H11DRAFT_487608 [Mycena galericulata]
MSPCRTRPPLLPSRALTPPVDLGAFFDNTPSAPTAPVTSTAAPSGSDAPTPTVSAPPTPDRAGPSLQPATGVVKAFLDRLGLADIPPKDKRFDGKVEARRTQRDVHSLAQQTGRVDADLQKHRAETTQVLEYLSAQIKSLQQPTKSLQATMTANARDISTANDRIEQLELIVTNTAAQIGSLDGALKTLIARFNAQAVPVPPTLAPVPVPVPVPAPIVPDDEPIATASSAIDTRMTRMETLLQQLVAKVAPPMAPRTSATYVLVSQTLPSRHQLLLRLRPL